jgi:hypothetical protein
MKLTDTIFGWLMIVSALLHCVGSYEGYNADPMALLWALSGGFAELLLGAINLLRVDRPGDRNLAILSVTGCVVWLGFIVVFGHLIEALLDFRVLIQLSVTVVLLLFGLRTLLRGRALQSQA